MSLLPPFGPDYPDLGNAVTKHRKAARDGLGALPKTQRRAYADAIEAAIRAKQRAALFRELPSHKVSCASGTNFSEGADIDAAIQKQHRSALLAYPSKVRRERTPQEWEAMYAKAMKQKRETADA